MNPAIHSVVLVRHARSTANDDPTIYRTVPDHAIPLARPADDPGALAAGHSLASLRLDPDATCSWCSTYLRCAQTESLVLATAFGSAAARISRRSSFLLREQEFGDWDCLTDEEMAATDPVRYARRTRMIDADGRFYFRYPGGESRADVTQRVALFIGKLHRTHYANHVISLHGVTQRSFRMAWLNHSVNWFEEEPNPPNASLLLIARDARGEWRERYL